MEQRRELTREEAEAMLRARGAMDGQEMLAALALLAWSKRTLADVISVDEGTVRQWGRNKRPVPENVAAWLRNLARAHAQNPPPERPVTPYASRGGEPSPSEG